MGGDQFISLPKSGDDNGHGGFKGTHYVFMKIEGAEMNRAVRQKDGVISNMPDLMKVIKVE